ncbi:unnamed protein product [Caenorhabditis bovis]|uniref:MAM domain-containing protein n=1 Tax=Caenorhabditis bovis TaxID=2654633 RepID=A0A8S1FD68_9PELO|nr:unnamed protein product [Caenorhabditis bovis]
MDSFTILIIISYIFMTNGQCPTSQIIDAAYFSAEVPRLRKILGGHTDVDVIFPMFKEGSPFGNVVISCPCDLECHDFDSFFTRTCRWHNERNTCDGIGDQYDWMRMRGAWGPQGKDVFQKSDKPDGFFLFVGVQQKMPETYSAMLVSDPIQCQQGDGIVKFRHWTSPGVKIRVCVRPPSMGKRYDWCSETIRRNNTNMAKVVIPGSIMYMFEIVVEAYGFSLDAFGVQGGAAAIDDISYNASAIYQCQLIPHIPKPINVTEKVCRAIYCDFDIGDCTKKLDKKWEIDDEPVGSKSTGILKPLEGSFGYVKGPGNASLKLGELMIPRTYGLQFCYFMPSLGTQFSIILHPKDMVEKIILFTTVDVHSFSREWQCKKVYLSINGTLEFSVRNLRNKYSYFGLDQIDIIDPLTSLSACEV